MSVVYFVEIMQILHFVTYFLFFFQTASPQKHIFPSLNMQHSKQLVGNVTFVFDCVLLGKKHLHVGHNKVR